MKELLAKYIVVTGGVLSGLGKGVVSSSVGLILKDMGFKITSIKIDPYLNIDCGLMSPYEHGEVFVLKDGTEVDLDLGNYERFMGNDLTYDHNITTGKIYQSVITKERQGKYLGKTVQIIPHITNEIIDWMFKLVRKDDSQIVIIEMGGTVGDIESMPFVEAMRQLRLRLNDPEQLINIHVSLVPEISGEQKTKPTQSSVRTLRSLGISPDIIVCRSINPIKENVRQKISTFCFSKKDADIISCYNVPNVAEVPLLLIDQKLDQMLMRKMGFKNIPQNRPKQLQEWKELVRKMKEIELRDDDQKVVIGIVGKYVENNDCYFSVYKSLFHSSIHCDVKIEEKWISSEDLEKGKLDDLMACDGIVIPGGFGGRGVKGKILGCQFCRERGIPVLGICLGFQCMVIEYCRNVLGMKDANSTEFDPKTKFPVVIHMEEFVSKKQMGATMRLGEKTTLLNLSSSEESKIAKVYGGGTKEILERHRHRYEVNPVFVKKIEEKGVISFLGTDEFGERLEVLEIKEHPYFVGVQYHPEFISRPMNPHPLFNGLVEHAKGEKMGRRKE